MHLLLSITDFHRNTTCKNRASGFRASITPCSIPMIHIFQTDTMNGDPVFAAKFTGQNMLRRLFSPINSSIYVIVLTTFPHNNIPHG